MIPIPETIPEPIPSPRKPYVSPTAEELAAFEKEQAKEKAEKEKAEKYEAEAPMRRAKALVDAREMEACLASVDVAYEQADRHMAAVDYELAVTKYRIAIKLKPDDSRVAVAMFQIAKALYMNRDDLLSVEAYREFVAKFPNHPLATDAKAEIEKSSFK